MTNKDEKIIAVIAKNMNDAIEKVLVKNPNYDALAIVQKAVFEACEKIAVEFNWSEEKKQRCLDSIFDNYNKLNDKTKK
jgi:hypothetical protein